MKSKSEEYSPNDARSVALRPVCPDDEDFLFNVYASSRAQEMSLALWDEAQREAFLTMQFTAQQNHYQSKFPEAEHQIILLNNRPIGRLYVDRRDEETRILDVTILPEHRNAGIGTS